VGKWRRRSRALGFSGRQEALRLGRPRPLASSPRVQGIAVASTLPQDQERPVPRWTLAASVAPWLDARHTETISRSSLWRSLHAIALTPHQSAYWLQSHAEDCEATAHTLGQLYAQAIAAYQQGRLGMCCDDKTGRPVLERTPPTTPAQPGRCERRAHESSRHGTRGLRHALAVATGHSAWPLGTTRQASDFVAPLQRAEQTFPHRARYAWGMDHVTTPWSRDVGRLVARWCKGPCAPEQRKTGRQRRACLGDPRHRQVLHCTPTHGAWLNHAAWFFRVVHRRFLARGRFPSARDFDRRLERFVNAYNIRHAHP
jgi:hypothetical protein